MLWWTSHYDFTVMRHIISTKTLSIEWVASLFSRAQSLKLGTQKPLIGGGIGSLLFYENSTRTKNSFHLALQELNYKILDFQIESSSATKGENITDTIQTLANLGANLFVIRHGSSLIMQSLEKYFLNHPIHIINAGNGMNEHPSQALLDLFTIAESVGFDYASLRGQKISIIGDCLHSRVARSNIHLLKRFGLQVTLVGPPNLVPWGFEDLGVEVSHNLKQGIEGSSFLMVLRIQKERQNANVISSLSEYNKYYGLSESMLSQASLLDSVRVLHPGPVNRNIEIESSLLDSDRSLVNQQVLNGRFVRIALIEELQKTMS